jgi:hypothetical protein
LLLALAGCGAAVSTAAGLGVAPLLANADEVIGAPDARRNDNGLSDLRK